MTQSAQYTGNSGPQCILIIDDDHTVRSSIKLFLEDYGYLLLAADNGNTGLELLKQHRPDLVLLDLRMPEVSGLQFLELVRETDSDTPVIVISGTGKINDVVEALRYGASDFLFKPIVDLRVLKHSIEKALEKKRLQQENREHRQHLEEIVSQRTRTLERTYAQLAKSEEKYRAIYENLQDVYFETSLDGVLREISPSLEKVSHHKRDELLGESIWKFYAIPKQREQLVQLLLQQGRVDNFEVLLNENDHQTSYYSLNAMLHRNNSGQPTHISGIMRNISERKTSEETLRTTNETLEALFNAAPLAILAIDTELRITLWNKAAEEIFGWTYAEIIGQPYPLAVPGKEDESIANLERALAGNDFKGLELSRRGKDGQSIDISASTAPLYDRSGAIGGVIIIIEDITEKQRLRSEADRYSRLAALGELSAGVAHEINNPNGLILLNLPTIRDFVSDAISLQQEIAVDQPHHLLGGLKPQRAAEAFPQLMNEIEDSAKRIKQIVDDLKSFATQESLTLDDYFDLNLAVETAVRLTANHLKKATFHFDTQLSNNLPPIKGSPQRTEQVIVNLLVNACEALTDRGQKITIKTGQDKKSGEIYLCVTDQGSGILPQQLPHITDPFFTTRRETGGTGLGLSVSARIIKEHNGRMEFTSQPGQGTSASAYFPLPTKG